jgi:hypothetical protein
MATTSVTVTIEVTSPSPLSTEDVEQLKLSMMKAIVTLPALPQAARTRGRSIEIAAE